jgi:hypothetical protein
VIFCQKMKVRDMRRIVGRRNGGRPEGLKRLEK